MATIPIHRMEVAKTIHGNSPWEGSFFEAATQTYITGAVLTFDGATNLAEAGADPVRIVGVAAGDANNDAVMRTHQNLVWIADDETIFVANVSGTSVTDISDVGRTFGIVKQGNFWCVDKTDTTNRRVIIVDWDRRDNLGDTNGRLHFLFLSLNRALSYTS